MLEGCLLVVRTLYRALHVCSPVVTKFKVFLAIKTCALFLGCCLVERALFGYSFRRTPLKLYFTSKRKFESLINVKYKKN